MLSINFIDNPTMFYFVVATALMVIVIYLGDRELDTETSLVSCSVSLLILIHSLIFILLYLFYNAVYRYLPLDYKISTSFIVVLLAFLDNYFAIFYPFFLLSLIRRTRIANRSRLLLHGMAYRLYFLAFYFCAIIIGVSIVVTSVMVIFNSPHIRETIQYIDNAIILVGLTGLILATPDLNLFMHAVIEKTFFQNSFISKLITFFMIGSVLVIIFKREFHASIIYLIAVIFVFYVHVISQNKFISIDFLTGLNNRNELMVYVNRLFERKYALNSSFKIIFFDVDNFKKINDTYGHITGDKALISIAVALKRCMRHRRCFICRYAGDEFVTVFESIGNSDVSKMFDEFSGYLQEECRFMNYPFKLSVSYGCNSYNPSMLTAQEFIDEADNLMYQQKKKRKQKEQSLGFES